MIPSNKKHLAILLAVFWCVSGYGIRDGNIGGEIGCERELEETSLLSRLPWPVAGKELKVPYTKRPFDHPLHTTVQPETVIYFSDEKGEHRQRVTYPNGSVFDASVESLLVALGYTRDEEKKDDTVHFKSGDTKFDFLRTNIGLQAMRRKRIYPEKYLMGRTVKRYRQSKGLFLDFACGSGAFTLGMQKEGVRMFGFDAILHRKFLLPAFPRAQFFIQADGTDTGLASGTFHGIFANYSPIWVMARELHKKGTIPFLQEAYRILVPGGFLAIGPALFATIFEAIEEVPFTIYDSSRIVHADIGYARDPKWGETYDYVILEKPPLRGQRTFLEKVFDPRHYF